MALREWKNSCASIGQDRHLVDFPGELVIPLRVISRYWSVKVLAYVRYLSAENKWNRAFDSSGSYLLCIDVVGTGTTRAGLSAVIDEIVADGHATGRQTRRRGDSGDVTQVVVG
jgi:hypothetical protein